MISQKAKKEIVPLQKEAPDSMTSKIQTIQPIEVTENIPVENSVDNKLDRLEQMFLKLQVNKIKTIWSTVDSRLREKSKTNSNSPQYFSETPFTSRYEDNKRSSMLLDPLHTDNKIKLKFKSYKQT